jgi:hypothetical protein
MAYNFFSGRFFPNGFLRFVRGILPPDLQRWVPAFAAPLSSETFALIHQALFDPCYATVLDNQTYADTGLSPGTRAGVLSMATGAENME